MAAPRRPIHGWKLSSRRIDRTHQRKQEPAGAAAWHGARATRGSWLTTVRAARRMQMIWYPRIHKKQIFRFNGCSNNYVSLLQRLKRTLDRSRKIQIGSDGFNFQFWWRVGWVSQKQYFPYYLYLHVQRVYSYSYVLVDTISSMCFFITYISCFFASIYNTSVFSYIHLARDGQQKIPSPKFRGKIQVERYRWILSEPGGFSKTQVRYLRSSAQYHQLDLVYYYSCSTVSKCMGAYSRAGNPP